MAVKYSIMYSLTVQRRFLEEGAVVTAVSSHTDHIRIYRGPLD
jgi:hypothetical protein